MSAARAATKPVLRNAFVGLFAIFYLCYRLPFTAVVTCRKVGQTPNFQACRLVRKITTVQVSSDGRCAIETRACLIVASLKVSGSTAMQREVMGLQQLAH